MPILGSLFRAGSPYWAQSISGIEEVISAPCCWRRTVALAARKTSANRLLALCVRCIAPSSVFHIPFVQPVVAAVRAEQILPLHRRRDVLLVELQHLRRRVLAEKIEVIPRLAGEMHRDDLAGLRVDEPLQILVLHPHHPGIAQRLA